MKIDKKIIAALLELLSEGVNVNKHSLCRRAKIHRYSLDYRINKYNSFIDVEVV